MPSPYTQAQFQKNAGGQNGVLLSGPSSTPGQQNQAFVTLQDSNIVGGEWRDNGLLLYGGNNPNGTRQEAFIQNLDPEYIRTFKMPAYVAPQPTPTPSPTPTPTPQNPGDSNQPSNPSGVPSSTTIGDDFAKKVADAINRGYGTTKEISASLGVSESDVDNALSSNYNLRNLLDNNKIMNDLDSGYKEYKQKMADLDNGIFQLNPDEQAQVQAVKDLFDRMRADQLIANRNYEGTVVTNEIRSGRQEFMNEISQGAYKQAVDDGLRKIKDVELQAVAKVAELKDAFREKRYKAVSAAYDSLNNYLTQKRQAIADIYKATQDLYDNIDKKNKEDQEAIQKKLQNDKLRLEIGKDTLEGLGPTLKDADDATIKKIADYYKIDENLVRGAAQKYKETASKETGKFDENMINKGYRIISPTDVSRMREQGFDVVEYKGRAYAKPQKLTSKVINKQVHWYNDQGVEVFPGGKTQPKKSAPSSNPNPTPSSTKYLDPKKYKSSYYQAEQSVKDMLVSGNAFGPDGKISPDDYNGLKEQWVSQNLDPAEFDKRFKQYKDKENPYYK